MENGRPTKLYKRMGQDEADIIEVAGQNLNPPRTKSDGGEGRGRVAGTMHFTSQITNFVLISMP